MTWHVRWQHGGREHVATFRDAAAAEMVFEALEQAGYAATLERVIEE